MASSNGEFSAGRDATEIGIKRKHHPTSPPKPHHSLYPSGPPVSHVAGDPYVSTNDSSAGYAYDIYRFPNNPVPRISTTPSAYDPSRLYGVHNGYYGSIPNEKPESWNYVGQHPYDCPMKSEMVSPDTRSEFETGSEWTPLPLSTGLKGLLGSGSSAQSQNVQKTHPADKVGGEAVSIKRRRISESGSVDNDDKSSPSADNSDQSPEQTVPSGVDSRPETNSAYSLYGSQPYNNYPTLTPGVVYPSYYGNHSSLYYGVMPATVTPIQHMENISNTGKSINPAGYDPHSLVTASAYR